jgi:hypothetical protein
MTVPTDPYSFVNGTTADATQVNARYAPLYAVLNGALDVDNLLGAVKDKLGLSDPSTVRRGKSIIAASESRTSPAYGTLQTPDQVAGVAVPTDGLLFVSYQAIWQEQVDGAARAAIFIGSNQLKVAGYASAAPIVQEARCLGAGGIDKPLATGAQGLVGGPGSDPAIYTGDVATGQALGVLNESGTIDGTPAFGFGPCVIDNLAAGTYTVSIQFKASSGYVNARARRLKVWTMGF